MAQVKINPGICGLNSTIKVESDEMQNVSVCIKSECESIQAMEVGLKEIDGYEECFSKFGDSTVYQQAKLHCRHPACPVPSAIIKGIEVACGLALPKDVEIEISKFDLDQL